MKFTVNIDSDTDEMRSREHVRKVLVRIHAALTAGRSQGTIEDEKGRTCGRWSLRDAKE